MMSQEHQDAFLQWVQNPMSIDDDTYHLAMELADQIINEVTTNDVE
tara:strand:- start:2025 stop:2162 length:138 start_codon:yes stop_codon:yes gene_type:complete